MHLSYLDLCRCYTILTLCNDEDVYRQHSKDLRYAARYLLLAVYRCLEELGYRRSEVEEVVKGIAVASYWKYDDSTISTILKDLCVELSRMLTSSCSSSAV